MEIKKKHLKKIIKEEVSKVLKQEQEKWAQDVDVEEGKMHDILGIPQDEDIEDNYDSGEQLAQDLVDAVGKDETSSMINFAANISDEQNIYDDAQDALEDIEE